MSTHSSPPMHLIAPFYDVITRYDILCAHLYASLSSYITLKPLTHDETTFVPSERMITQQLKFWPLDQRIYPPAAWVEPRTGQIEVEGTIWTYALHGTGLTFVRSTSSLDVSIEFARGGEAAMTEWTFRCYLEGMETSVTSAAEMLPLLDLLFEHGVEQQILQPVPPLLDGADQTYLLIRSQDQPIV